MDSVVYLIKNKSNNHYKIGISDDVSRRLIQLQTGNSCELEVIAILHTSNAVQLEQDLHHHFNRKHIRGEWFELDDTDVEYILTFNSVDREKNNFFKMQTKNPIDVIKNKYPHLNNKIGKYNPDTLRKRKK